MGEGSGNPPRDHHTRRFFWVPEGVVFQGKGMPDAPARIEEIEPAMPLFPYVRCYWKMTWELGDRAVPVFAVPSGCVNLVIETSPTDGRLPAKIVGLLTEAFRFSLRGTGTSYGVQFTPGGFHAFYGGKISRLVGVTLPLGDVFPEAAPALAGAARPGRLLGEVGRDWDALLGRELPASPGADLTRLHDILRLASAGDISSPAALAAAVSTHERRLQRLFEKYVGMSPRAWLRTKRFQDAAKRVLAGAPVDWAGLAAELGYYDQSHFLNDFRALTGTRPSALVATG